MASFKGKPAFCSKVYPEPWTWSRDPHLYISGVLVFILKNRWFHALYDFFHNHPSFSFLPCVCGLCLGTTDPVLDEKCQWPPPPPSFLFPWVSGSWIMKHDLRRLPGDHRWAGKAGNRRLSVKCERMQSVHSAACPSAPVHQGWCQVKTMAYWTGCPCMLTGVNIDTIKATYREHGEDLLLHRNVPAMQTSHKRKALLRITIKPESPWNTNDDQMLIKRLMII